MVCATLNIQAIEWQLKRQIALLQKPIKTQFIRLTKLNYRSFTMSEILITLHQILDKSPNKDLFSKVIDANGASNADFYTPFPLASMLESNGLDATVWTLQCLPEYDLFWRKFACWCVSQVVDTTTDSRVIKCLEVVDKFTNGKASTVDLQNAHNKALEAVGIAEGDVSFDATDQHKRANFVAWVIAWAAAETSTPTAQNSDWNGWYVEEAIEFATMTTENVEDECAMEAKQHAKLAEILKAGKWVD